VSNDNNLAELAQEKRMRGNFGIINAFEIVRGEVARIEAENARLTAELAEAKAALEQTGIAGIYADFVDLADAIRQMAQCIKEQQAELTALKGRTCATCKEFGVVDGHGHCNRFLSPRDTWSFCECWEPRKDKEAPKPKCDNCRHWTLTGLGFGRGFCELRPDDGRNWYCCDTCPKWESKEAPDA